jgi:cytidine deaminase
MYSDSIEMDGGDLAIEKVIFSPFTGIAPFHYRDFFEKGRRKGADGRVQIWLDGCARPNINLQYPMYILFEPTVVAVFGAKAIEIEKRRRKY